MGKLTVVVGPMFSGKTTYLFHHADTFSYVGKVLYITHSLDTRSPNTIISTHNKNLNLGQSTFDVVQTADLSTLTNEYLSQYVSIFIDEAQFYENLEKDVVRMVDVLRKNVFVAGLNGTSDRKIFRKGELLGLVRFADEVVILKSAFCMRCNLDGIQTPAVFTHRLVSSQGETLIGGGESYMPVCRKCWCLLNPTPQNPE
jgi:thymidine kinase